MACHKAVACHRHTYFIIFLLALAKPSCAHAGQMWRLKPGGTRETISTRLNAPHMCHGPPSALASVAPAPFPPQFSHISAGQRGLLPGPCRKVMSTLACFAQQLGLDGLLFCGIDSFAQSWQVCFCIRQQCLTCKVPKCFRPLQTHNSPLVETCIGNKSQDPALLA